MELNIKDLKNLLSKINLAVEKSKLNPMSGWIELETDLQNNIISFKVANTDYYLTVSMPCVVSDSLHVTLVAETFIPLISKLDDDTINIYEKLNSLIIETSTSNYTFPLIKEMGKTKCIDTIDFEKNGIVVDNIVGDDLASISLINSNGLVNTIFSKDIQQYIYVDNIGALTFTENIYVNNFKQFYQQEFKFLLTYTQSKLLDIFKGLDNITLSYENFPTFNTEQTISNKLMFEADNIKLILITQDKNIVDKFPSIKIRNLSNNEEDTHVIIDKKLLDKALARLMIFDKKFDITVMDYSKIVFKQNSLDLVSIKNKNSETISYIDFKNVVEHESIIRFADLVKQLKAINNKTIDISYGSRPAIIINNNDGVLQVIPEIQLRG